MFNESPFELSDFKGKVRLFPLPNLVLFPHVMQPLHIFEPRYRALLEEALSGDGLIAMAVLAPGWEANYDCRPALEPVACLCRIANWQKTPEGTYNVLLVGVRRIRLLEELPPDKLFREARVEILDDIDAPELEVQQAEQQAKLVASFQEILPTLTDSAEPLLKLLSQQISLGMLTEIMSYTLDLGLELKLQLLGEPRVAARAELLIAAAQRLAGKITSGPRPKFPPEFSMN